MDMKDLKWDRGAHVWWMRDKRTYRAYARMELHPDDLTWRITVVANTPEGSEHHALVGTVREAQELVETLLSLTPDPYANPPRKIPK